MLEAEFHKLVSGKKRGLGAMLMRAALLCAEAPYAAAVTARNWRYDRQAIPIERVAAPVISVGNLTLGGTGKTPMVKWIARWLRERKLRVTLVSRGYGAEAGAKNDEALELEQALPDVPHLQNRDRVAAARTAIEEFDSQVILLDDGFQHRRLGRDLDIVLLDATEPFGYGHIFPRGSLRESIRSLRRAQVVCLTRADLIEPAERDAVRRHVASIAPQADWCEAVHQPNRLMNSVGSEQPLDSLQNKRVSAFCGIGNPSAFRRTLESSGANLVAWQEFPDHHAYTAEEVAQLSDEATRQDAELLLCTHKDLVKLQTSSLNDIPLYAVVVEMAWLTGQQEMERQLESTVNSTMMPDTVMPEGSGKNP